MELLKTINENLATGNQIEMETAHKLHMKGATNMVPDGIPSESAFAELVRKGMNAANQDQLNSQELFVKMITEPESVEVHDVSIAMAKANMSLQMTKSIVDGAVKAYKEIINMR